MSACGSFGTLLIPLSLLHPCAFVCMCSLSICEKMCCLSLSQVSLVNEMPDSRGTNLDKWSPRTGHKACNVPASAESSPGQKHNAWFWTLCSLCLNKAWLKHVFVLFLKVIKRWMNKEVQTGDGCGSQQRQRRKWTRACEGRARVCECVCVFSVPSSPPWRSLGKKTSRSDWGLTCSQEKQD